MPWKDGKWVDQGKEDWQRGDSSRRAGSQKYGGGRKDWNWQAGGNSTSNRLAGSASRQLARSASRGRDALKAGAAALQTLATCAGDAGIPAYAVQGAEEMAAKMQTAHRELIPTKTRISQVQDARDKKEEDLKVIEEDMARLRTKKENIVDRIQVLDKDLQGLEEKLEKEEKEEEEKRQKEDEEEERKKEQEREQERKNELEEEERKLDWRKKVAEEERKEKEKEERKKQKKAATAVEEKKEKEEAAQQEAAGTKRKTDEERGEQARSNPQRMEISSDAEETAEETAPLEKKEQEMDQLKAMMATLMSQVAAQTQSVAQMQQKADEKWEQVGKALASSVEYSSMLEDRIVRQEEKEKKEGVPGSSAQPRKPAVRAAPPQGGKAKQQRAEGAVDLIEDDDDPMPEAVGTVASLQLATEVTVPEGGEVGEDGVVFKKVGA